MSNYTKGAKRTNYNSHIYAAYRGDAYLMDGTLDEIAAALHRKRRNLQWYTSKTAKRREEEVARRGGIRCRLSLVLVE